MYLEMHLSLVNDTDLHLYIEFKLLKQRSLFDYSFISNFWIDDLRVDPESGLLSYPLLPMFRFVWETWGCWDVRSDSGRETVSFTGTSFFLLNFTPKNYQQNRNFIKNNNNNPINDQQTRNCKGNNNNINNRMYVLTLKNFHNDINICTFF